MIKTESLFCWAPVFTDGEVDIESIHRFDDELDGLANGWQWMKFELKAIPENRDSSMKEQA